MGFRDKFYEALGKSNFMEAKIYKTAETASEKLIKGVKQYYAKDLKDDEIVAIVNNSLLSQGKSGCVITDTGFYSSEIGIGSNKDLQLKNPILFTDVDKMVKNKLDIVITFKDGKDESVFLGANDAFIMKAFEIYKQVNGSSDTKEVKSKVKIETLEHETKEEAEAKTEADRKATEKKDLANDTSTSSELNQANLLEDLSIYETSVDYWKLYNKRKNKIESDLFLCFIHIHHNSENTSYKSVFQDGSISSKLKCAKLKKVFNKQQNRIQWNDKEHFIYSDKTPVIFTAHNDIFYASTGFSIDVSNVSWVYTNGSETIFKMIDGTEQHENFGPANYLITDIFQDYFEKFCEREVENLYMNPDGSDLERGNYVLRSREKIYEKIGDFLGDKDVMNVIGMRKLYFLETFSRYIWVEASKRVVQDSEKHKLILSQAPVYVASLRSELGISDLKSIHWKGFARKLPEHLAQKVQPLDPSVMVEEKIEVDGKRYYLNKSAEAIFNQGVSLLKGTTSAGINERAGWALIKAAAERGNTDAMIKLAVYIVPSSEDIGDYKWNLAMNYLKTAVEAGEVEAITEIGNAYYMRDDYKSAMSYWYSAIHKGSVRALVRLGNIYHKGVIYYYPGGGVIPEYRLEPDFKQAEECYLEAAEKGSTDAKQLLEQLYKDWGIQK